MYRKITKSKEDYKIQQCFEALGMIYRLSMGLECNFLRFMGICCIHSTPSRVGGDIWDTQNFRAVEVTWWVVSVLVLLLTSSIPSLALNYYWL